MEDTTLSGFGDILKAYRKQRKISQQELASRLDLHRNTIGGWERGDFLPESKTIVLELAKQLHLNDNEIRRLLEASLTAITPYWNVPYQRNLFFTGREELLHTLHEQLCTKQAVALCQSYALSGLGGIGKTQTAIEYAYQYALDYRAIFWVAAETVDTLFSSFATIAELIKLPEHEEKDYQKIVKAVQRWFAAHDEWLLIFDNVEEVSTLKPFLPASRQGAILITTRLRALDGLAQTFELLPFPIEEGIRFLLHRSRLLGPTQPVEDLSSDQMKIARTLVEMMGGLPLALDQAGAYIEKTGCSLTDYLQLYQSHQIHLLNERSESAEHPSSVVKTFLLSFEQMARTNVAAADMLRICAFLAPDAIPEEFFTRGAAYLGSTLSAIATDVYAFNQAIGEALYYSLLQRNSQNKNLSLHRLLQVVLKATMDPTSYMQWATRIIEALAFCGSSIREEDIWLNYSVYIHHAQNIANVIEELHLVSLDVAQVFYLIARYLREHAQYAEAEDFYHRALSIWEQILGPTHPQIANTLRHLSDLYRDQGNFDQMKLVCIRSLHILEQIFGPDHLETSDSLRNLGTAYSEQGNYEMAEPLLLRALQIKEQALGSDHPQITGILNSLGYLYGTQENYEMAEPFFLRSLHIRELEFGPDHPLVAFALNNLGNLYRSRGDYEQAEALLLRCLYIRELTLGPEHPLIAYPLSNLGSIYQAQEKYTEAASCYQRALAIREQNLGNNHPVTAETVYAFAAFYHQQGAFSQAEPFYCRALLIREQVLGISHPKTNTARAGYVQFLRDTGRYDEANLIETEHNYQYDPNRTK